MAALPVDAVGLSCIYGRLSCDTRALEIGASDRRSVSARRMSCATRSGQDALLVLDELFVPPLHVFMVGEFEHAAPLVARSTTDHPWSYVCKAGVGDVLIGAAVTIADYDEMSGDSHAREMFAEKTSAELAGVRSEADEPEE